MLNLTLKTSFSFILIFLIISCSSRGGSSLSSGNSRNSFYLKDRSGEFLLTREVKFKGNELATRVSVTNLANTAVSIEKTVSISKTGMTRGTKLIRPEVSQHTIWYEKEKYFSQLKTNIKNKSLSVLMKSPEEKWQGTEEISYPKGKIFCFYSQIPECVKYYGMLTRDSSKKYSLIIIWDNYPYHVEAYSNLPGSAFQSAKFYFDNEKDGSTRYRLDLFNQVIFYEFDVNLEFDKMYWIAQGITLVKKSRLK